MGPDNSRVEGERLSEIAHDRLLAGVRLLKIPHIALYTLDLQLLDRTVGIEQAEVDAKVSADMGERAVDAHIFVEVAGTLPGFGLGASHDEGKTLDVKKIALAPPRRLHLRVDRLDQSSGAFGVEADDEGPLGVAGGEITACARRPCLEQDWRALRRRLGKVRPQNACIVRWRDECDGSSPDRHRYLRPCRPPRRRPPTTLPRVCRRTSMYSSAQR